MTAPQHGAQLDSDPATGRASVVVDITADDGDGSGVQQVTLALDGSELQPDANAPYQYAINPEPGVYSLTAIATDYAGNVAQSEPVEIGIDERPPIDDDDGGGEAGDGGGDAGSGAGDGDGGTPQAGARRRRRTTAWRAARPAAGCRWGRERGGWLLARRRLPRKSPSAWRAAGRRGAA
ncbi:MAG: Ig-like domain-containing protein [Nannocystaceae bacterium]